MRPKRIIFTVTNDLNYDQRMARIAGSLAAAGFEVLMVGTRKKGAAPLSVKPYRQTRLRVFFQKGPGFYAEFNIRLFFYLLFARGDIFCGIDMDTLLPVWLAASLRGKQKVYDAHEFFSQQNEVIRRPAVYRCWLWLEKLLIPRFPKGYTVSSGIAAELSTRYRVNYEVVRNLPVLKDLPVRQEHEDRFVLYQGAVNEARGLEYLVPAFKQVDARLLIYGDGNFMEQVKMLIRANNLDDKVLLKGMAQPEILEKITGTAYVGLNLVEHTGLNQYYSLANKFFDYIHAGVPQVSMDYPEYRAVNDTFEVAVLIKDLDEHTIADAINRLLRDESLHRRLAANCLRARESFNWQSEEKKLISFYQQL